MLRLLPFLAILCGIQLLGKPTLSFMGALTCSSSVLFFYPRPDVEDSTSTAVHWVVEVLLLVV